MRVRGHFVRCWLAAIVCGAAPGGWALDPHRSLTQYSRTVWTQADGLPQDTIKAIVQTADGYLWLGTDEGLARFDGYEFTTFDKSHGDLPSNSITALAATADGGLWIGTASGLTEYRDKRFRTFTTRDGLPDAAITGLYADHEGALWVVAGVGLSRLENGRFTNYAPGPQLPVTSVRAVVEDRSQRLWVGGLSGVGRLSAKGFTPAIGEAQLARRFVTCMAAGADGTVWVGTSGGVLALSPDGVLRSYRTAEGLPDPLVRALWCDRYGYIWAGTNRGVARFNGHRFTVALAETGVVSVRSIAGDREGNLWVGDNSGLSRLRDEVFTVYGRSEGWPSDEPTTAFQDRAGRVWVGFHESGLMLVSGGERRVFTRRDGLPDNDIFSIQETRSGDLLIGARNGLAVMHGGSFRVYRPEDRLNRFNVYDALEDGAGRIWLATAAGMALSDSGRFAIIQPADPVLNASMVTLCLDRDGAVWAGTFGQGLWRIRGQERRRFTTADGLSSDAVRSIYQDPDGTLWIGTFGGGLNSFRDDRFLHYTQKDGLLSDNVVKIIDDGASLWLATTRGISRLWKSQLREFAAGRRKTLVPLNYGVADGLRSAQCAPEYPASAGGVRLREGAIWFPTARGMAVYDPRAGPHARIAPVVHVVEITAGGAPVDLSRPARLAPGADRLEVRYTALHLSAPERVEYSYKLEGLERDWVRAGSRRLINYNSLPHGTYRFVVRAQVPEAPPAEASYAFVLLPHYYETTWFRLLALALLGGLVWLGFLVRVRQIGSRFALVLEERARLAREIHDTLAQGFVGISSQLDAVAMCMPEDDSPARQYLQMARRMARHSLTEARRSMMDLRASVLEDRDLAAALEAGARAWTAGQPLEVSVESTGDRQPLPQEMEQQLLRIAQEAVANIMKHANASRIGIKLERGPKNLRLRIVDNGRGFEERDVFAAHGGHFGLIGMRERAERLGGGLHLASRPGEGTEVEVSVPLP
ncbi:MAG: two-component regulator propeller domain-containing protein [Bryobacteraceae bacterium]|jgi:ligand-binding sensor domain-containing protein/two-component sensor histidine kinase